MTVGKYKGETDLPCKLRITIENEREYSLLVALVSNTVAATEMVNNPGSSESEPFTHEEVKKALDKIYRVL